ncbi:MAG TPA: sporulation protein YabP [Candidatus Flavonifractor merdavium]|nr:sporulation protein YabP [Candidatus Flavonifractor merdavium]
MPYEDNRGRPEAAHHIIVEERERLSVSGVEEVERFDENTIVMTTVRGTLVIQGENLHIEKLSLDGGDLKVEGDIDALSYEDSGRSSSGGLLSRLFR